MLERSRLAQRVPPHLYFVVSAVFHYLGPAFAVLLFARVDVLGVAWMRIAAAALGVAVWARAWGGPEKPTGPALGGAEPPHGPGLGRRAGRDELLLLRGDRPAAAGHGGGDRVPARDPAGRA